VDELDMNQLTQREANQKVFEWSRNE
jgi:hypothetical protein